MAKGDKCEVCNGTGKIELRHTLGGLPHPKGFVIVTGKRQTVPCPSCGGTGKQT